MKTLLLLLGLAATAAASENPAFQFPAIGAPASSKALLLAIDDRAFPLRNNLALFITHPQVRAEPVLGPLASPDAPDNVAAFVYGTVLKEGDLFRLWYYSLHTIPPKGASKEGPVCYAESKDGIHWVRPDLGQVEWHGSRHNNIIALDRMESFEGAYIIREDDDPRPDWRYKMVYYAAPETPRRPGSAPRRIGTAVSPDGLRWKVLPGNITGGRFAELSSLFKQGGLYIVSSHIKGRGADDREEGREAYGWVSPDFVHWLPETAPQFKTPEPRIGSGYGTHTETGRGIGNYVQDHEGIGAASFGNVVVGLWGMWHQNPINWGEGGIYADLGLVVSEDGLHFDEVVKGQPFIRSTESAALPFPGKHYPTILTIGNTILNVGNETFIYHSRWRNAEFQQLGTSENSGIDISKNYWGGIALARIPRDRWGGFGLSQAETEGSLWTTVITLPPGAAATLNATGLSGLRVEVADARFRLLPGFAAGAARADSDAAFDAPLSWAGRSLSDLAGRSIRLHVLFHRLPAASPRLYAINLLSAPQ